MLATLQHATIPTNVNVRNQLVPRHNAGVPCYSHRKG